MVDFFAASVVRERARSKNCATGFEPATAVQFPAACKISGTVATARRCAATCGSLPSSAGKSDVSNGFAASIAGRYSWFAMIPFVPGEIPCREHRAIDVRRARVRRALILKNTPGTARARTGWRRFLPWPKSGRRPVRRRTTADVFQLCRDPRLRPLRRSGTRGARRWRADGLAFGAEICTAPPQIRERSRRQSCVTRGRMSDLRSQPVRFRFPAARRLKLSREFQRVREEGRTVRGGLLMLGVLAVPDEEKFRVGLVTSRRVGGATERNRVRRRLREMRPAESARAQNRNVAGRDRATGRRAGGFRELGSGVGSVGGASRRFCGTQDRHQGSEQEQEWGEAR